MTPFLSSLDDWYSLVQWATVVFGALALVIGSRVNARQSVEIEQLKKETANAQLELAKVQRQQMPRWAMLRESTFSQELADKPKGNAIIWFIADNEGARRFAMDLYFALQRSGWIGNLPSEIPPIPSNPSSTLATTLFMRATGGMSHPIGVVLRYPVGTTWNEGPTGALAGALTAAGLCGGGTPDETLTPEDVKIVIGDRE